MDYTILFLLLCCIILITIIIILHFKNKKLFKTLESVILKKHELEVARKGELKNYFQEEWDREEKTLTDKFKVKTDGLDKEWQTRFKLHQSQLNNLDNEIKRFDEVLKEKEKRYNEVNQDLETYKVGKIKEIDSTAAEYEQRKRQAIDHAIEEHKLSLQEQSGQLQKQLKEQEDKLKAEIEQIKFELETERSKRAAINEEIRRQKEVKMKQDFYRIQFNEEDKNDVEILRSIAPRLRHPEAINKVIWSAYYQKPLTELRKRLLPNGDKSGIYKITRLKTGEIYIGSTTSFDTRFVNHYKTALGVGTLASSQLHRMMREDGPEHFTVEILEEDIPKEKLKERESYYIDFYDSKNYGLNTIRGEQK